MKKFKDFLVKIFPYIKKVNIYITLYLIEKRKLTKEQEDKLLNALENNENK